MSSTTLAGTDVVLPPLAIGAMFWGTTVPAAEAHHLLDHLVDRDVAFVDTANNYPCWLTGGLGDESELCLGRWLAARGSRARGRVVLATKLGARPAAAGGGTSNALGLSRPAVLEQIQGSLRRLQTDHVDLLYAHIDDRSVPLAETVGALQETVERGLTRAIACSNLTAARLREALAAAGGRPGYVAIQNRFTLLSPDPAHDLGRQVLLDDDVQQVCTDNDLTMLAYSTLLEGAYTRGDRPPPPHYQRSGSTEALATLRSVADAAGLDAGQAVLAWLAQREHPVIPVVGVSRPDQIDSAMTAVGTQLPDDAITALERARAGIR